MHSEWTVVPDLTFLFDIEPEIAVDRCGKRGEQTKFEKIEFLKKVRENFLSFASDEPERFVIIDASRSREDIEKKVVQKILEFIRHD